MRIIKKLKIRGNIILGKISNIKKRVDISKSWHGNDYGGFFVADNYLTKDSVVYSFGVGEDISFDESLISKYGCSVYAFDPTPRSIQWITKNNTPSLLHFFPYGLDDKTGIVEFLLPKNDNHVSGSVIDQLNVDKYKKVKVPMKCLTDIVQDLKHNKIDVLKMDIEGSEYKVLDSILAAPVNIKQILIEIHERFFKDGKGKTKHLVTTLKNNGYELFGISDGMEELSFIKIRD